MPSLLAGALGALLGRLDEVREAIDFANELHAPSGSHSEQEEQEERVDPYIGEGWLPAQQDIKNPAPPLLDKHDVHNQ